MTTPIASKRLHSQQLIHSSCTSVAEVVQWMGAMQAQDYDMVKWGIGLRLPGSTEALIEDALNRGEIVRTHLMRPTWHIVAAADIYWLLDLTAPQVNKVVSSMYRKMELDEATLSKSDAIIERALADHNYQTRDELMNQVQQAGIQTNDLRSSHLMFHAELAGLVCNGLRRGKQHTYALLRERVPTVNRLSREEALAELAKRYFTSHGPATLRDFVWWSGLGVTDSKRAIDMAKTHLEARNIDGQMYWFSGEYETVGLSQPHIKLLPAFDEFMVSYCDRSASIAPEFNRQAMSGNGIFWPIIVVDGQVVGLWKRAVKPKQVTIDFTFFYDLSAELIDRIWQQAERYGDYWQKPIQIR